MPAITALATSVSQTYLQTTAQNYTPQYAKEVENLLVTLVREVTDLPLKTVEERQQTLAGYGGYGSPGGPYGGQYPSGGEHGGYHPPGDPYGAQHPSGGAFGEQYPSGYPQTGYHPPEEPYGGQYPYADGYDSNAQAGVGGWPGGGPGSYGYGVPGYQGASSQSGPESYAYPGYSAPQNAYGASFPAASTPYPSAAPYLEPIHLTATLLRRTVDRSGRGGLVPIQDGEVLRDGRGDPSRGDRLKVLVSVNCACWVYVIGIDATGYVAQIFPDPDAPHLTNPLTPGREYLLPDGPFWWGLDEFRGVEQVHFVASRTPRPDIEASLAQLARQPRDVSPQNYVPVTEPVQLAFRGLVKVSDPVPIDVSYAPQATISVTPDQFVSNLHSADLLVTRWFRHE